MGAPEGGREEVHASEDGGASSSGHSDSEASSDGSGSRATLQLCPLDLRFSQKKMRNVFADGRLVEDAAEQVTAVARPADEAELYDAAWRLEAPFPPIEVLRWRCKLRDETTGRPLLDESGREMFEATESWFTLDNRRLYCLQKAATKLWPERCTVDVVAEIRKDRRMREIRKFRTLDSGQSILVGSRVDCVPFKRWAWRAGVAAQSGQGRGRGSGRGGKGKGYGKAQGGGEAGGKGGKAAAPEAEAYGAKGKGRGAKGKGGAGKGTAGYGKGGGKGKGEEGGKGKGEEGGKGKGEEGGKGYKGGPGRRKGAGRGGRGRGGEGVQATAAEGGAAQAFAPLPVAVRVN